MTQQPTTSVRVRENQRRSRARRKEYIEGLEDRLQKFERHGVQATIEVQSAARKVAKENNLLRSLLNLRGVSNSEIETYLWHNEGEDDTTTPVAVKCANTTQKPAVHPGLASLMKASEKIENMDSLPMHIGVATPHSLAPTASLNSQNNERVSSATAHEPARHQFPDSNEYPTYQTARGSMNSSPETDASMNNMTSCEYAARIIAGMRGDYDDEIVRTELGCATNRSCTVDNMAIFYALDK